MLWTNNFWPMDKAASWGTDDHDLKFGLNTLISKRAFHGLDNNGNRIDGQLPVSDDGKDHNSYFGMTFYTDFVVDPGYIAPLRYFFFGDDDLWVFLSEVVTDENGKEKLTNTQLIADMGGVHPSIGEYVDLWDYIKQIEYLDKNKNPNSSKRYRLTFYYTERGASGSTCYMRFSLPFESLVTTPPSHKNQLKIEKKVESVDSAVDKLGEDDEFVFVLHLYNENGTEFVNRYPYTRYKKVDGEEDTPIKTTYEYMFTNAEFYLRDGEYIIVDNLPAGMTYTVEELEEIRNEKTEEKREYTSTAFYTGTIEEGIDNNVRLEGRKVSGRVDDESNIELPKINYVTYVNALNPGVLTLKKQMTGENIPVGQHHFKFNVTLTDSNDNPVQKVSWMKYLSDNNDRPDAPMEKQEDLENAEGKYVFELESKEKIMLYNLPVGTKYTITEESDDHFPLNKVEVNGSRVPSDNNTINGSIGDDPTRVEVVFTNTAEVSIEKSQAKVTDTGNEDFTTDILTVKKGDIIAYRLTVKNNSKVPINGLTVEDEIPYDNNGGNRLTLVQGSINEGGELQSDNKTILWEIPTLDPGKEVNLQFKVEVTEIGESQSWKNIAVLKEPGEPDEPSNPVYIVPKLEIKKDQSRNGGGRTTDTLGVNPGDEVTYYITVTNNSKGDAKDVTVTDEIPLSDKPEGDEKYRLENPVSIKGRILGTDKVFGGEREGDIIKWDLFDLAAGQTAELEFTVTVPDNGYHWKNIGYVSYTPDVKPDPNDPDAPKPEPTPPEPTNEVEIEKGIVIQKAQRLNDEDNFETNSLIVKEGSVITYQITVKNDRDTIVRDLVIEDEIPLDDTGSNRLTLVENSITAGGVLEGTVIKWKIPELAPQKEQKLEFKVKVEKIGESQSWKNIAILKEPDKPDKPSNPVYEVPNLEIRKDQSRNGENRTTDTLTVKAGDKVTYYITVSNNSKGDTKDVTVTDEIPLNILPETDRNHRLGPVEEGSIRGVVHETGQAFEGSQDGNVIKWDKFDLKAGQTATLRFTVSVPQGGYHWKNVGYVSYTPDIKPDPDDPNPQKPEPTKPEPTNEVEIEKPEISIRKTQYVGDDSNGETEKLLNVKPGDVITYCLTVNNGSDKDATDVIVTDRIPEGLTLVDGSISDGGTVGSDNVIAWKLGTLKAHESKKVRFKTVVPQVDKAAKWTNIAYVTSGDPDPDPEEDPKIPSNPVEAIPGIKIEKTQQVNGEGEPTKDLLHVKKDDKVTYYLTITNTSDATAFDVEVKDRVPEDNAGNQLELIGDSVQGGINHNVNGRDITWKLGDLKAGESQTVEFTVIVPAGGTYWLNGASTSFVPPDPENPEKPGPEEDRTPDIPSNEVEIEKPDIRIRKTQYVGNNGDEATDKLLSVKPGDVITYRLTVTNGSDKNATDVIVTDQIPEGLTLVNGSVSDGGTVGSDDIITWKLGTLGGGESKTVQFKATVPQVDEAAIWRNIAYVTSGNPDPDPEEDPKTPSNPVEAVPGITIEKTQQRNGEGEPTKELLHVKKDDRVTYYLTITNTSETTAFDVDVKDTVPKDNAGNELILVEDSVRGGESHDLNGREIIWHLGDLASGASQVVEFTVIVPTEGSRWINGASTSYIPPDPEDPDKPGPEEDRTPDIPSNEVEIEKSEIRIRKTQYVGDNGDQATEGLLSVKPGDVITYRLTVTNESDGEATDVIVTDQIPEGLTLVNGSVSDGGTVGSDDIITWKLGTLGGGESKTVQFKATVPQVDEAAIWRNIAYVTSGNPDPDPEEDPKTPSNPVEAVPGISIEKTQQVNGRGEPTKETLHVQKGDEVTYYLTVSNTSDAKAFDVIVTDEIPEDSAGNRLELIEDSIEGGESHAVSGRVITWNVGDLDVGESQTLSFTVRVPSDGSRWRNMATTSYVPGDPDDPEKPGPEGDRTPDIPSNEVEIEAGTTRIQLRARKVLNGADLVNGQFTFRIQGIQAEILEETDSETQSPETTQKPGEAGDTGENGGTTDATPSNAEREDGETGSSRGIVSGLIRPGGKTITSQVMLQAQTLTKVEGLRAGNHDVPMPSENTATNNEDGEIVFGEIEYSRPGTYTYKITEVKETRRGYTFDTTEYTVEVVVTRDDMTGELMARVNIVKPEGAEEILFTNRYRRPSSGGGKPSGGGGSNPQPGPGTDPSPDPTPENPDTPTPENPENPQPTPDTPALPDPNDPNSPPTVTIEENGVPRTYVKVWDPVNEEFIYIPEEDVPLFGLLPKTGEEERRRRLGVILVMSLAGIGTLMTMEEWRRRKREREIK